MKRTSLLIGLILALVGTLELLNSLSKPRVQQLHGADILGLVACGFAFGVSFVGLIGKLNVRGDT